MTSRRLSLRVFITSTLLLLTTSLSTTLSLPQPIDPAPVDTGVCGHSTFIDTTSRLSPLAADCLALAASLLNLPPNGGDALFYSQPLFAEAQGGWDRIAANGTCVFGIRTQVPGVIGPTDQWTEGTRVGGRDVADLVRDAITLFSGEGKGGNRISAWGTMDCNNGVAMAETEWAIFRKSL